jgi:phage-related minor tail protein
MDDGFEDALVRVRADTRGFAADVEAMRDALEGPLADGAERAGRAIESALTRAVRTGKLGFDDLQRVAASAMAEIARSAISSGLNALFGGGGGGKGGGLLNLATNLLTTALGAPGRATGGPVSGGRAYMVGERGPELFVPSGAGRVEPLSSGRGRDVRVVVNITGAGASDPQRLAMSGRRVAQAVRRAVELGED